MTAPPQILMCPPDYYGVEYEINPWMERRRPARRGRTGRQWRRLHELLVENGVTVYCLAPRPGLPDLVFTANAALIYGAEAIPAHFRHPERQGEERHAQAWLSEHGFHLCRLPPGVFFEGAGDALFCGDILFGGYRIRSDMRAYLALGELLPCRIVPLELVDPRYYHLDTCFCPLAPGVAICYPAAFDRYGRKVLHELVPELIPVSAAEAAHWACNAVVVGRTVITNTGCPELHRQLRERGYHPQAAAFSEFVKAGGSAKCLTLRLDGEEAAGWRRASRDTAQQSVSPHRTASRSLASAPTAGRR
jgi:N-dimethylarginine dimethylaminohydrolase